MTAMRALDISSSVGSAYTGKLLAEVGWDVLKFEPASGDPTRREESRWGGGAGAGFAFANQGKRGVSGDVDLLTRLASAADAVIGDFSSSALASLDLPGDLYQSLRPRYVLTSISAFGITGPRAEWASSEIVVQAASGLMFLTGEYDQPPMQLPPYQGAIMGGTAAAAATMAALRSARADGHLRRTDVAMVEALAAHTYGQVSSYVYRGEVARREAKVKGGLRMVPASDRFVYCAPGAVASMRMDGIAILINEPKLAEERFQTAEGRMQNYDEFVELFVPPFAHRTAQEWFEAAEKMHMTFALVQTIGDLFACPQIEARGLFRETEALDGTPIRVPGRPFRLEGGPEPITRPAPRVPGADTQAVIAEWLGTRE